jgi:hypothetical protein
MELNRNHMNKAFLIIFVLLSATLTVTAQSFPADSTTLQLHGGTQGFGLAARHSFTPKLAARLGASYGSVKINDGFSVNNLSTDNTIKGTFSNVHLYGEYSAVSWLRLVAGAAYLFKAEGSVVMTPNESVTQNGITLQPEDLGILTTAISYKKFAPYLGLGFGRGLPQKRFNANVDLGFYYLSAPTVTMTGTEYLEDNEQNGPIITENMKNYRFLPVLQLNLNYKLSK